MMKKQYIQPSEKVVKLVANPLLNGASLPKSDETPDEWGARGDGVWFDEDDDEE
jgi:hypothetical protein